VRKFQPARGLPERAQEIYLIERFEKSRNRLGFAHKAFRLFILATTYQDRRQIQSCRGQMPAQLDPVHSRHVDVQQHARVAGWKLAGQELFCALKVHDVESQDLQLPFQRAANRRVVIYHN